MKPTPIHETEEYPGALFDGCIHPSTWQAMSTKSRQRWQHLEPPKEDQAKIAAVPRAKYPGLLFDGRIHPADWEMMDAPTRRKWAHLEPPRDENGQYILSPHPIITPDPLADIRPPEVAYNLRWNQLSPTEQCYYFRIFNRECPK